MNPISRLAFNMVDPTRLASPALDFGEEVNKNISIILPSLWAKAITSIRAPNTNIKKFEDFNNIIKISS